MTDTTPRPTKLTHEQRIESASADLGGYYLGQPRTISREFQAWIAGYRDLGADALVQIATEAIENAFECEEDDGDDPVVRALAEKRRRDYP
jgi:hypothetical protein